MTRKSLINNSFSSVVDLEAVIDVWTSAWTRDNRNQASLSCQPGSRSLAVAHRPPNPRLLFNNRHGYLLIDHKRDAQGMSDSARTKSPPATLGNVGDPANASAKKFAGHPPLIEDRPWPRQ